jgi:hypothetical protein
VKDNINELAMSNKNENTRDLCRGSNECKRSYRPRNNLLKVVNADLLADSQTILNRWKNFFSQVLNVHNVSDVRPVEYIQLNH